MADPELDQRQSTAGDPFTNVAARRPPQPPTPRWKRVLNTALRGISAAVLLAAGTVWTIRQQHPQYLKPGELLHLPAAIATAQVPGNEGNKPPTDSAALVEIRRVAYSLHKYTNDTLLAQRIAGAIVTEGGKKNIDPGTL